MKIRIHSLPVAALAALCLFQPCLTHGQTTVTNGLIAHLKFENNYTDEIGNITTAGPAGAPTFETGLIGKAIHMVTTKDGATNDYVTLGYPGVLVFGSDATSDTTDFSFSFWVKVNHQADDQAFISNKDWNSGGNKGWIIASEGDGMKWNLRDDGGSGRRDSPHVAPAVVDGRWHHIAVTFQRTNNAKIYVDGALINTTSMAPDAGVPVGSLDTDNLGWSVNLGQDGSGLYTDGGSAEMDFLMDDLGAWRRLLAENEVSEIYNKGLVGKSLEQQAVIPTSISSQPTNQTVLVGFNVDFKVIAVGLNLKYQWNYNGYPVTAATNSILTLKNVTSAIAGTYLVTVNGDGGSKTSGPATLTVNPPSPVVVTNGLAVHLKFDGNYNDSSPNGLSASPVGTPTFASGRMGQAVHISTSKDGTTDDYVSLGYPDQLKFGSDATSDTTDFSVAFWVNYTHSLDDQPFISNKNWGSGGNLGWGIFSQSGGNFKWNLRDDISGRRDSAAPATVRDGDWHQIVVTFQRTNNALIYVDGNLVNTGSIAPDAAQPVGSLDAVDPTYSINLGQDGTGTYTDGGSSEIDMLMDDVAIWRRLLTANEIANIFSYGQQGISFDVIPVVGPPLSVTDSAGSVTISWPSAVTGFTLESTASLTAPSWSTVGGVVNNSAKITIGGGNKFYRLRQ